MREEFNKKIRMYESVNDVTLKGEIVVFGSSFTANFPFYELAQKYVLSYAVYNRSIDGMTLAEAEQGLDVCVLNVKPYKIFLALGECDLDNLSAMTVYRRILAKIALKLPNAKVYVLPVLNDGEKAENFNRSLALLAERMGVKYLPLRFSDGSTAYGKIFKELTCFFRRTPMSFSDAFNLAGR